MSFTSMPYDTATTIRHLLAVPRFPLNTCGRRAFSVAGLMAWNSLPEFIYPGSNVLTVHLSVGANSAPQNSWLDFGQGRTSGKGWGKRKGRNVEGEGAKKEKERRGKGSKNKRRREGNGRNFILCSCDFSLRATLTHLFTEPFAFSVDVTVVGKSSHTDHQHLQRTTRYEMLAGPILSVFFALIVHSELQSVHPGFPVAFIFKHKLINK